MIFVVLTLLGVAYAGLRLGVEPPLPMSLVKMYMALLSGAILVYLSSSAPRWEGFKRSLLALLLERSWRWPRWAMGTALPVVAAYAAYGALLPSTAPTSYLRTVHPTPPKEFEVRKKVVRLDDARNPFRTHDAAMQKAVEEGKALYYQNCFYCHGDHLDGKGHFAQAFTPRPLSFEDPGTIASITEAAVFWRVSKGGKGLPVESWPWASAMPAWEEMLSEEEIWKVILYIYAGVGREPKSFGDHAAGGGH